MSEIMTFCNDQRNWMGVNTTKLEFVIFINFVLFTIYYSIFKHASDTKTGAITAYHLKVHHIDFKYI